MRDINQEDPNIHWDNVNVINKIVLDLGCGDFGNAATFNYPTTLEYFINKGAKFVIGLDSNAVDVNNILKKELPKDRYTIINDIIDRSDKVLSLIKNYHVDIIKSDIEGGEQHLINMSDDDFSLISEYYIETHGDFLYRKCLEKLISCGYEIYDQLNLTHTNNDSKVIFAKKKQ